MLLLMGFILLVLLFTGFLGRIALGLLILLPVILIALLLLKLAIIALPVLLVIGIVALLLRGARRNDQGHIVDR